MQKTQQKYKRQDKWISSIIVVTFDLEEGQKISVAIPRLPQQKQKQISMLSFPDTNSLSDYQNIFKYIFKTVDEQYGYVSFKQKKDSKNSRGYTQRSFVIITKFPFLAFFQKLSQFLVFKLFANDEQQLTKQLEFILKQSQEWPEAEPLTTYNLPVLDYQMKIDIPNFLYQFNGKSILKVQNYPNNKQLANTSLEQIVAQQSLLQFGRFQQVRLTDQFQGAYEQIWALWENVILNRPCLLMADNPQKASQCVLAAVSLMNPIQYGGQFYPYVTVYDSHLNKLQQAQSNLIFGATNPLFFKLFSGGNIKIIEIGKKGVPKHLKPIPQLLVDCNIQQHKLVNESALRKFFYKINSGIIALLQEYTSSQANDLKFFNEQQFIKFIKNRQADNCLTQIFASQKYVIKFWTQLVQTLNFSLLLRNRNIARQR